MGQQAECVGVSLEMGEVFPLVVVEGKCFFQSQSVSFREIGGNGFFTRVSERGISQVVCQTCCRNDRTDPVELVDPCFVFIFFGEGCRYVVSQRPAYAWDFEAVRESVVYEYTTGQRKNLCFILQPTERRREDQTVVVALEVGAGMLMCVMVTFQSEAFRRQQSFPTHDFFVHSFSPLWE